MTYAPGDEAEATRLVRLSIANSRNLGEAVAAATRVSRGGVGHEDLQARAAALEALASAQAAQTQLALAAITWRLQVQAELRSR